MLQNLRHEAFVHLGRCDKAKHLWRVVQGFYRRNGLSSVIYFDRATWGVDRVVPSALIDPDVFLEMEPPALSMEESIARMPLSEPADVALGCGMA